MVHILADQTQTGTEMLTPAATVALTSSLLRHLSGPSTDPFLFVLLRFS